jgi:hypothetical protein
VKNSSAPEARVVSAIVAGSLAWLVFACGSSDATSAAASTAGAAGMSGASGGNAGTGGVAGSSGGSAGTSGSSGSSGSAGAAPDPCPPYVGTPTSGQVLCAWLLGKHPGQGVAQDPMALTVPAGQTLLTAGFFVGSIDFGAGEIDDKPAGAAMGGGSAFFTEIGATRRSTLPNK